MANSRHTRAEEAADNLSIELAKVHAWSLKWQMGISAPKSKVMCFSHKGHHSIKVNYNNQPLEQVDEIRSLGVTLDEKLCYKAHVDKVKKTVQQVTAKLGVFSKEVG